MNTKEIKAKLARMYKIRYGLDSESVRFQLKTNRVLNITGNSFVLENDEGIELYEIKNNRINPFFWSEETSIPTKKTQLQILKNFLNSKRGKAFLQSEIQYCSKFSLEDRVWQVNQLHTLVKLLALQGD